MKPVIKRFLCVFSAILMLLLASCVQKPHAEETTEWEGKEEIELDGEELDKETAALAARYDEFERLLPMAFSQMTVSPESDFKVTVADGKVMVTEYIGKSDVVVIPETIDGQAVTAVAKNAFKDKKVRAIYIPDSVTLIEKSALEGIVGLATLRLPVLGDGENTHLGYLFGADSYEKHATKVPATVEVIILGNKITEIPDNAFAGCKSISAVALPITLEKIGSFAFYECYDLVYVKLNKVVSIGEYAFGYCSSLFKMTLDVTESVGLGALYECSSLRYLGVSVIGKSANENRYIGHAFGAESADYNDEFVPESLYAVGIVNCKDIPDRAFAGCSNMGEIILMDAESIGVRAFYACRLLTSVLLPDSLKTIGDDAFFGCDNLKSLELGSSVESIGMQAFYGCRALSSFEIPEKVTEIKPSTFALCVALEEIELNNVKKIGKDAFWGCKVLEAVDCSGIEVAEGNSALVLIAPGE